MMGMTLSEAGLSDDLIARLHRDGSYTNADKQWFAPNEDAKTHRFHVFSTGIAGDEQMLAVRHLSDNREAPLENSMVFVSAEGSFEVFEAHWGRAIHPRAILPKGGGKTWRESCLSLPTGDIRLGRGTRTTRHVNVYKELFENMQGSFILRYDGCFTDPRDHFIWLSLLSQAQYLSR